MSISNQKSQNLSSQKSNINSANKISNKKHISSHLILVEFKSNSSNYLKSISRDEVKKIIIKYIESILNVAKKSGAVLDNVRYVVNVIKAYVNKKNINIFAYIWCTKYLKNIIFKGEALKISYFDIIFELERKKKGFLWCDIPEDYECTEKDFKNLLKLLKEYKPKEEKEIKFNDEEERLKYLREVEELWKIRKKENKVYFNVPESKDFILSQYSCGNICKCPNYFRKITLKDRSIFSEEDIELMIEYFFNVSFIKKKYSREKYFPRMIHTKDEFSMIFPPEETHFAYLFFSKIIIERNDKPDLIGFFELNDYETVDDDIVNE